MLPKSLLTATTVAALGMLAAPAAHAAFPGENGPIVFGQAAEDRGRLVTLPFGGEPSTLLATARVPSHVEATADGSRILYNENDYSLWVANADGSEPTRLTPGDEEDYAGSWSPDGTKIVFSHREDEGDWELWTMNADGSGRARLGEGLVGFEAQYSPDGTQIAYTELFLRARGRFGDNAIKLVNADGTAPEIVAEGREPEWTPDGRALVFVDASWYTGYGDLARIDLGADEPVDLTDPEDDLLFRGPSVSPDGTKIVAETERLRPVRGDGGWFGMATLDIDGSDVQPVTAAGEANGPDWTPVAPDPVVEQPGGGTKTTTQPQPPAAPAPAATSVARSVTAPRVCGSRRFFTINVRGKGLQQVRVVVNGKRVTTSRKGGRHVARVDLRTLPKGRFAVKIRKTFAGGVTKHETRRYRTCAPKGA